MAFIPFCSNIVTSFERSAPVQLSSGDLIANFLSSLSRCRFDRGSFEAARDRHRWWRFFESQPGSGTVSTAIVVKLVNAAPLIGVAEE